MTELRNSSITYQDTAMIDAFGRARVSSPFTLFDSSLSINDKNLLWDKDTSGTGTATHDADMAEVVLSTGGTASGAYAIRQSHMYVPYQPGKSHLAVITGVLGTPKSNVTQRIGYFDADDGIIFECVSGTMYLTRRTSTSGSAVDNQVAQSAWNIDKMDGTGASGINLDFEKTQIFFIDLEWLGVGRVRAGFVVDGLIYYCHQFLNTNSLTEVYMQTATLPVRYEIRNTGVAASSTDMQQICSSVMSEGGFENQGVPVGALRTSTLSITTTFKPLISVRLKSANVKAMLQAVSSSVTGTSNDNLMWKWVYNGSLTGASFTSAGADSIAEYDVTATAITGGHDMRVGTLSSSSREGEIFDPQTALPITEDHLGGTRDIWSLCVRTVTGTANGIGGANWKEIY